jgi:prevent-host-death family protein
MYIQSMPKAYSVAEARTHLADILDEVEAGTAVQLTRRGRPVAVVLSSQQYQDLRSKRSNFGDAYRLFLGRYVPGEIGVDADFFDSLRDREPGRRARL